MITANEFDEQRRSRLLNEFDILTRHGFPVFPVDQKKHPIGQWAHGEVNYVLEPMTRDEAELRVKDHATQGWAVLCGNRSVKTFTLDVEAAGMEYPEIQQVLRELPDYAKRPSPSGGEHVVGRVTEGDPVHTQKLARVDGVLLAETRGVSVSDDGNGGYAVVTGPGRGPLPDSFAPVELTRFQVDGLLQRIRALHRATESERRLKANKQRHDYTHAGARSGTGGVISAALERGTLSWVDVLDSGWAIVGYPGSRIELLRPSYGPQNSPTSTSSANAQDNVLVVHSTSVPWADPGEAFNPPQAFAAANFKADFHAAMCAVEAAASALMERDQPPTGLFAAWPREILEEVYVNRKQVQREYMESSDEQVENQRTSASLRVLGRDELRHLPRPEPLIHDTLDRGTLALLAGPPASYKTFVALDWACSIASGASWSGRQAQAGRVLYLAAEGAYGLNSRIEAWEAHNQRQVASDRLLVIPEAVQIANRASLEELLAVVDQEPTLLVVIDTLARSAVGLDENAAKDMGLVINAATQLLDTTDRGVVLLVHHTGKDGTTVRGSSALEGAVDTVYTTRAKIKPHLVLERRKRKDGPEADVVHLEAVQQGLSNSLVLASSQLSNVTGNPGLVLSSFQSNPPGHRLTASDVQSATALSKSSTHAALKSLLKAGHILEHGDQSPRNYSLAVAV